MKRKPIEIAVFTPRQISQKRAENALAACLPDELRESWLRDYRHQNRLLREGNEQTLSAAEFIFCRLQDFLGTNRSPF